MSFNYSFTLPPPVSLAAAKYRMVQPSDIGYPRLAKLPINKYSAVSAAVAACC